jgi:hypothetical protein
LVLPSSALFTADSLPLEIRHLWLLKTVTFLHRGRMYVAVLSCIYIGKVCAIMPATVTQNSTCLDHIGRRDKK